MLQHRQTYTLICPQCQPNNTQHGVNICNDFFILALCLQSFYRPSTYHCFNAQTIHMLLHIPSCVCKGFHFLSRVRSTPPRNNKAITLPAHCSPGALGLSCPLLSKVIGYRPEVTFCCAQWCAVSPLTSNSLSFTVFNISEDNGLT